MVTYTDRYGNLKFVEEATCANGELNPYSIWTGGTPAGWSAGTETEIVCDHANMRVEQGLWVDLPGQFDLATPTTAQGKFQAHSGRQPAAAVSL